MIEHARFSYHICLPGIVHFRIVIRFSRDGRTDDGGSIILCPFDEGCIAGGSVVGDVGGIRWIAHPEEVAHGQFSTEDIVSTAQGIEGEGLQNHLAVGIADIYTAVLVEFGFGGRFGDNVPSLLVENIINALFHITGVEPVLLELDVHAGTVAGVLLVLYIGIVEVVL